MERYFLHIRELAQTLDDPEGALFETLGEARREAVRAVRQLVAAEVIETGRCELARRTIVIADAGDRVLDVVNFWEVVIVTS